MDSKENTVVDIQRNREEQSESEGQRKKESSQKPQRNFQFWNPSTELWVVSPREMD